ncbi:MAG: hypothetical protein IPH35_22440 [Rhodoferax sp.]|nr:hypothetical protein [Rhodoferax sp.]
MPHPPLWGCYEQQRCISAEKSIEQAPFALAQVLQNAKALFGKMADDKGVLFVLQQEERLPPWLQGDALRLGQVLNNLLSNAVKFTQRGQVTLRVESTPPRMDDERHWLVFSVIDAGIGMSAEQRARLFQPFTQADESTTRRFGGTGLGLVIARRLIELMGGRLSVHSAPGQGSTFAVELPFGVAAPPQTPVSTEVPKRLLEGLSVLLVEDNAINAMVATQTLRGRGAVVHPTGAGLPARARGRCACRAHGHPDAGDGRPDSHAAYPQRAGFAAAAHRCHDRQRAGIRQASLCGCWNECARGQTF